MLTKLKNANILIKNFDILKSYDMIIENNRIKFIKPTDDVDDNIYDYDKVINCNGNFLIPGFKNVHTHNAMVFMRSFADDLPFDEWYFNKILPQEDKLTEEDVYYFSILGIMENLTSGITGCCDMYKYYYVLADAYLHTGFRLNIIESLTKYDKLIAPEEFYNAFLNYKGDNRNLIKYDFGIHAEYTNDKNTIKLIADLVHKYKKPFFSHNSETLKEVNECKNRWGGLTPTEVNEEFGLYDYGGGGYHCIYLNDNDINIFKKHNLTVVANIASNLKFANGIIPLNKYMENDIKIAFGTDGPASNNAIDMFREMYLATVMSKYEINNPSSIKATDIIKMATINGAKCMSDDEVGVLEVGKKADVVLIDVNMPNMQPMHSFVNNLVYACGKQNVKMTMVDGKVLYENGNFYINEDVEYIYKKCRTLLKNLLERT